MTFCQIVWFSSICHLHGLVIFRQQKIVFSAKQLIIQKRNLAFSITKPRREQFEAVFFLSRAAIILYLALVLITPL
jgi:hypothetical protein